tara:strand:+ start:1276 stop:1776 length:501 start_codon:yes stop_codon:yes gene_type:complete
MEAETFYGMFLLAAVVWGIYAIANYFNRGSSLPTPVTPKPKADPLLNLVFKSNRAFFDYQCKFGIGDIQPERSMFALVTSDITGLIARTLGQHDPETQVLELLVVSPEGGVMTTTHHKIVSGRLATDDLVVWVPLEYRAEFGWMGIVTAKCAPEFQGGVVKVLERY